MTGYAILAMPLFSRRKASPHVYRSLRRVLSLISLLPIGPAAHFESHRHAGDRAFRVSRERRLLQVYYGAFIDDDARFGRYLARASEPRPGALWPMAG